MSMLNVVGWIVVAFLALGTVCTMALLAGLPAYFEALGKDAGGPR